MGEIEEPVLESAPLARRLASQLCANDAATGVDCSWYHGMWQYLRLLGLVSSVAHRGDFYQRALETVRGGAGAPRVLISGTGDYAMLAHVLPAFRAQGVEPEITVVDMCETPLALNRWYAARANCRIETVRRNVLELSAPTALDAVCADAFLGRFAPEERSMLLARWRDLLRPGGKVITVNGLRPDRSEPCVGFSPEQAQAFCDYARRRARDMRETLQVDPDELAKGAEIYARRHRTYPVRSTAEIRELFERSGFQVEPMAVTPAGRPGPRGPSTPGNVDIARIVATRF